MQRQTPAPMACPYYNRCIGDFCSLTMRPLVVRLPRGFWTGDFRLVVIVVDGHLNQLKSFGDYLRHRRGELRKTIRTNKNNCRLGRVLINRECSAIRRLMTVLPPRLSVRADIPDRQACHDLTNGSVRECCRLGISNCDGDFFLLAEGPRLREVHDVQIRRTDYHSCGLACNGCNSSVGSDNVEGRWVNRTVTGAEVEPVHRHYFPNILEMTRSPIASNPHGSQTQRSSERITLTPHEERKCEMPMGATSIN
jgi:hypothetical protein